MFIFECHNLEYGHCALKQPQTDKTTPDKEISLLQGLTEQLKSKLGKAYNLLQCFLY